MCDAKLPGRSISLFVREKSSPQREQPIHHPRMISPRNRLVLAVLVLVAFLACRSRAGSVRRVVIDTDAGADDAIAILLTLQAEPVYKFEVLALTCTYGNTEERNVETNVRKTLTVANRSDITVYGGAERPLLSERMRDDFFGTDGLGDFRFDREITAKVDKSRHAAVALIELAKKYPNEITLLALGPLTNIAIAIAMDPGFLDRLDRLVILGSSVAGHGAASPGAEFNFFQDPHSNFIVLNSTKSIVTLIPWEAITAMNISKDWRINVLGRVDSDLVRFINNAERVSLRKATKWNSGDTLAAAVMIWPEIVDRSVVSNVYAVTDGAGKGTVLVDYRNVSDRSKNAHIVQTTYTTMFQELLLYYLS